PESGRHSKFGIKFGGFIEDSIFHYENSFSDVADVDGGIAVDECEVGQLASGDGAQIFIHAHDAGGVEGGILQDMAWGNAGLDVEFEFAVEGESGHIVGTVFDGEAGVIEKSGEVEHLGEGFFVRV